MLPQLSRRGFIGALGLLVAAPAIVKAESLMRVRSMADWLTLYGDGVTDDAAAINALIRGKPVRDALGRRIAGPVLDGGRYLVQSPIVFDDSVEGGLLNAVIIGGADTPYAVYIPRDGRVFAEGCRFRGSGWEPGDTLRFLAGGYVNG